MASLAMSPWPQSRRGDPPLTATCNVRAAGVCLDASRRLTFGILTHTALEGPMKPLSLIAVCAAVGLLLSTPVIAAQKATSKAQPKTKEDKIKNAMSAAPKAIAKDATVLDHPAKEGGEMPVLRKGSNDWTCLPDDPSTPANDPMCLDKMATQWAQAWMTKQEPQLSAAGIGYMLQGGGSASNIDPFAKKPAPGETWMKEPPHIMMFPAGKLDSSVYSTDMHSGGPWIMWVGTPYEHLMIPVR
jgi:hypothetical protein